MTPGAGVPRVTVLDDARGDLCRTARGWLDRPPRLVPPEDLTVVGDGGEVRVGAAAWVVCLWALEGERGPAHRLSTPSLVPAARAVVTFVSRRRRRLGTYGEGCDCTPA